VAIKPLTLLNGTVADANEVEAIFLPLYTDIAPINVDVPNKLGTGRFVLESALTDAVTPVGGILPFYDFNGVAVFDPTIWNYCDGSVINSPGSPIDGQTLPDLSGRYIVGFGTIGGGDIDTAPFATAPVGIANSQLNVQHVHTVNNHTHTGPNHTHAVGTLSFTVAETFDDGTGQALAFRKNNGANTFKVIQNFNLSDNNAPAALALNITNDYQTWDGQGATALGGTGNTGGTAPGTTIPNWDDAALDASLGVTDIRPSSIRVRFIMKIN